MKKNLLYLGLTGYLLFALCTRLQAQTDSLQAHRYVTRATMYGVGFTNVFDTYLSPQEYKGIDFRISRETIRMTKLFDGNVSVQNFFQADVGYTHNRADNNNTFSGLVNWNYGLHYQFRLTENFKLLAGGLFDVNGGFVYNLRNSNNPAGIYPCHKPEHSWQYGHGSYSRASCHLYRLCYWNSVHGTYGKSAFCAFSRHGT